MSLQAAHEQLRWPVPGAIIEPSGAGAAIQARLAQQKIQKSLRDFPGGRDARVGVLVRDPTADATEEPMAVVCEFPTAVPQETLQEAHRLAWNFCRSKLLLLVEPHLVRAWSCYERPPVQRHLGDHPAEVQRVNLRPSEPHALASQAAWSLHWLSLVSGDFVRSHPTRFKEEGRADRSLLSNLKAVREELRTDRPDRPKLTDDVAHDLLARIIFIKFLFDRKDANGRPALGHRELERLHKRRILTAPYHTLGQILGSYEDSYRLFRWLNSKFNGDLFPGKGATKAQQEAEWRAEMAQVKPPHLALLAVFVEGRLKLKGKSAQLNLWPLYSFDAIPIEFISSIYEEFVGTKPGVRYTPGYLVDFILDGALPWEGEAWDLRVLDPACGSGIFLVKVFQRLVHRWRAANPGKAPRATHLKRLLTHNIFGVDLDEHAVRVASFSLYLAMCDEIDPRHYWNRMRFPRLRGRRLVHADFFEEREGIRSDSEAPRYDLVVGNAPWGQDTWTRPAEDWANTHGWPLVNKGIGTLFLAKAARLTKPDGGVAMMTSASALLFNRGPTARAFRGKLFDECSFEEVVNLSAVRFGIFSGAKSAACMVLFRPVPPRDEAFSYVCPKPTAIMAPVDGLVIEPHDVQAVYPDEAASDPWIWTALLWGGRRDLELLHNLARRTKRSAQAHTGSKVAVGALMALDRLDKGDVSRRKGIVRGDRRVSMPTIVGRPILEEPELPNGTFLRLRTRDLPVNQDPGVDTADGTSSAPFEVPQLIIKKAWSASHRRFSAVVVEGDVGVICTQAYVTVHVPESSRHVLDAACVVMNSVVATYYLFLTSGRSASFIPEALVEEVLSLPLPASSAGLLEGLTCYEDVDARVKTALALNDAEWILVQDFVGSVVRRIQDAGSGGWRTRAEAPEEAAADDQHLLDYCEQFVRVLRDGVGARGAAIVFRGQTQDALPIHLVALYLDHPSPAAIKVEQVLEDVLIERLAELDRLFLRQRPVGTGGVFFQRTARIYDTAVIDGVNVPVVYVVKPRARRYWTKATALRDADEVVVDAAVWMGSRREREEDKELRRGE